MSNVRKLAIGGVLLLALCAAGWFLAPDEKCTTGSCTLAVSVKATIEVRDGGRKSRSTTVEIEQIDPGGIGLRTGSSRARLAVGESKKFAGPTFRLVAISGDRAVIEIHHNVT